LLKSVATREAEADPIVTVTKKAAASELTLEAIRPEKIVTTIGKKAAIAGKKDRLEAVEIPVRADREMSTIILIVLVDCLENRVAAAEIANHPIEEIIVLHPPM